MHSVAEFTHSQTVASVRGTPEKSSKLPSSPNLRLAGEWSTTAGVQRLRAGLRQEKAAAADLSRQDGSDHPLA